MTVSPHIPMGCALNTDKRRACRKIPSHWHLLCFPCHLQILRGWKNEKVAEDRVLQVSYACPFRSPRHDSSVDMVSVQVLWPPFSEAFTAHMASQLRFCRKELSCLPPN